MANFRTLLIALPPSLRKGGATRLTSKAPDQRRGHHDPHH